MRVRFAICGVATVVIAAGIRTFGDVHPDEVFAALRRVGPLAAGTAAAGIVVQLTILLTRLWFLFPDPRPSWLTVAHAFSIGEVVNNFVPARAGDALKIGLIGRSRAQNAGVLLTDLVVNVGTLLILVLAIGPDYVLALAHDSSSPAIIIAAVATFVIVLVWLARRHKTIAAVLAGMAALRDWRRLSGGLLLSVGNWTAEFIALRFLAGEVGGDLRYADALHLLLLLNLGIAFNVSIANAGSFELPIAIGLRRAGVGFPAGLAVGVTYHVLQIAVVSALAAVLATGKRRNWFVVERRDRRCGHAS